MNKYKSHNQMLDEVCKTTAGTIDAWTLPSISCRKVDMREEFLQDLKDLADNCDQVAMLLEADALSSVITTPNSAMGEAKTSAEREHMKRACLTK